MTRAADHGRTTVFHARSGAAHSAGAYWLTKRRDGRSDNWMIARYQRHNRSIVYRSCRTQCLETAVARLEEFAAANPMDHLPLPNRACEFVYFIEAATGQIKIGVAHDVSTRLAQLQTMSPVKLWLLATTAGGKIAEAQYHKRFAAHRLHGEWFERCSDILAEIERIKADA